MRLLALKVADFGAVERAEITLGPGLNVLHGPNDLGKSTLAAALRAVLLLPHGSRGADPYAPWHSGRIPTATLSFEAQGRIWRVTKSWARGSGGSSLLEISNDGVTFSPEEKGRGVDGRLRSLLGWGIPEPGGKGGRHGLPSSFLATVLLAEQASPYGVLGKSLLEDATDSGREKLIEAMAALAQHPVFKAVLDGAQTKVDEAFTATGQRRRGKDSPFSRCSEAIAARQAEYDHLRVRLAEADAVSARLAELDARRDRLMSARADARERVETLERDLQRARARAQAQTLLDAARSSLQAILDQMEALEACRRERTAIDASLPVALERVEQAAEARRATERDLHAARAAVEAAASGDAGPEAQALERRKLQLQAERMQATAVCERAAEAVAIAKTLADLERELAEANEALERVQRDHARNEASRQENDGVLDRIAAASKLRRLEACERRLAELRETRARAEAQRHRADALEAEAAGADASDGPGLPDREALERLEQLHDAARMAEAALGGGLSLEVDLHGDVPLGATIDGDPWPEPVAFRTFEAERTAELRIGEVARVRVVSGDVDRRRVAEEARRRYADAAQPVLQAAGVDDLVALREVMRQEEARRGRRERLREQAAELRQIADEADVPEAALEAATRDVEGARIELGDVDRRAVLAAVGDADEGALREREAQARQELSTLVEARERLAARATELRTQTGSAQARREELRGRLEAMTAALEGEASSVAERIRARLGEIDRELEALDAELAQHAAAARARAQEAQAARIRAEEAVQTASAAETQARAEAASLQEKRSAVEAKLELHTTQLERVDVSAAEEQVQTRERELALAPEPTQPVDEDLVEEARRALVALEQELDEVEAEVRKAEGALQQVGGQVVRERAEAAREALDRARREAAELELDYDAWRLLAETLREAENDEGQNLGQVLGAAVAERFAELTRGRYGELEMSPDLQTEGIRAAGDVRSIEALSEGLKEQLATLLRISIAEQLACALVLDDHLTQTDPDRIEWFRDVLRTAAGSVQIVILTCRPTDYLSPPELTDADPPDDRVRAIDLTQVIHRA